LSTAKDKEETFGCEFLDAGLKDIILPGDIKEILNTILIAEKKALANIITRREETASTRSLLNTAKLMDENATLFKLKELEYLERIAEKVGNISLSSSGGILEQLHEIVKVSK
jgi:regulator of protease activity HflC (stomatin/prohibitin superfamily)